MEFLTQNGPSGAAYALGLTTLAAVEPKKGTNGPDILLGTEIPDKLRGFGGDDWLFGRRGDDLLFGGTGKDNLFGGWGNDTLVGGNGADKLFGGLGLDLLIGGRGDDVLVGGGHSDYMFGGEGADRFVYLPADILFQDAWANGVEIFDFSQLEGDQIDLRKIDAVDGGADDAFTFIGTADFSGTAGELRYEQFQGTTYFSFDTDGDGQWDFSVGIAGLVDLTAADFVL